MGTCGRTHTAVSLLLILTILVFFSSHANAECPVTSEETGAHLIHIDCGSGTAQLGEAVTFTVQVDNPAQVPLSLVFSHQNCMRLVSPELPSMELSDESSITQDLVFEAVEVTPSCQLSVMVSGIPLVASVAIDPDPAQPDVLGIQNPALAAAAVQTSSLAATCAAPYLVKDIYPGVSPYGFPNSSDPYSTGLTRPLAPGGAGVLFAATDATYGREPWSSDGTAANTELLVDIAPGSAASSEPVGFVYAAGKWFFSATHPSHGRELWATDGTAAGTYLVKDIAPGTASSTPLWHVANGDRVFFTAYRNFTEGRELWVTDGTEVGTYLVADLVNTLSYWEPTRLTAAGGKLYFTRNDPDYALFGWGLWVSDGTAAGTHLVKDLAPGPTGASPEELTALGNKLYFTAFTPEGAGEDLWVTDGSEAGTHMVRDIVHASDTVRDLAAVGEKLYFTAIETDGWEPWISDGTAAGTRQIKDVSVGGSSSPQGWAGVEGRVFFTAYDPAIGEELWITDGTAVGTYLVKDIYPGPDSSGADALLAAGNQIYFRAQTAGGISELWVSDGTEVGTQAVSDLCGGVAGALPTSLAITDGKLYFSAITSDAGRELWAMVVDSEGPVASGVELAPNPVAVNAPVVLRALLDDSATGGSAIAAASYTVAGTAGAMSAADGTFDGATEDVVATIPAFSEPGVHSVCVQGTDGAGNTGAEACVLLAVYDPAGGFVTGGGWIQSAAGACQLDPACAAAEGKANFAFVLRYKKDAVLPSGSTELNFSAGNFKFHAQSYDWLIIPPEQTGAQFQGAGTVNGALAPTGEPYLFSFLAADGATDTIHVQVWYTQGNTDVVVYDNGYDQALDGGSIKIHD